MSIPEDTAMIIEEESNASKQSVALPRPPILAKEMTMLLDSFKRAAVLSGQIVRLYGALKNQRIPPSQTSLPKGLVNQLGAELETYDRVCDVVQEHILQAIAVITRDIDREKNRQALKLPQQVMTESSKPNRKGKQANDKAVINIDSDSDENDSDIELLSKMGPSLRPSTSAPQGISLSALQASPSGGVVVDLKTVDDDSTHAPPLGSSSVSSPRKRGSISLRLDLSSEALRGMPVFGAGEHSPVTLAPRTARMLSAYPSVIDGPADFFPLEASPIPPNALEQNLLTANLVSAMSVHPSSTHDLHGSGAVHHLLDLSTTNSASGAMEMALTTSHEMDLDLFGEIDDDDDMQLASAQPVELVEADLSGIENIHSTTSSTRELEHMLSQSTHGSVSGDGALVESGDAILGVSIGEQLQTGIDPNTTALDRAASILVPTESNSLEVTSGVGKTASFSTDSHTQSGDSQSQAGPTSQIHADDEPTAGEHQTLEVLSTSESRTEKNPGASESVAAIAPSLPDSSQAAVTGVGPTEQSSSYTPFEFAYMGDLDVDLGMNLSDLDLDMQSLDFSSLLESGSNGLGGMDFGLGSGGLPGDVDGMLDLSSLDGFGLGMFGGLDSSKEFSQDV